MLTTKKTYNIRSELPRRQTREGGFLKCLLYLMTVIKQKLLRGLFIREGLFFENL